jgi:hypothetical protein
MKKILDLDFSAENPYSKHAVSVLNFGYAVYETHWHNDTESGYEVQVIEKVIN